jgi:hypothetical protein
MYNKYEEELKASSKKLAEAQKKLDQARLNEAVATRGGVTKQTYQQFIAEAIKRNEECDRLNKLDRNKNAKN